MTDKRPFLALAVLAMLAACNEEVSDDGRAASGEVLEGTVSDAMLPLDRVQSEPPLEDPEAFAKAQSEAAEVSGEGAAASEAEDEAPDADVEETSETAVAAPPEPAE